MKTTEELQAENAALREALEDAQGELRRLCECPPDGTTSLVEDGIRVALSSDAGREFLERLRKTEAALEDTKPQLRQALVTMVNLRGELDQYKAMYAKATEQVGALIVERDAAIARAEKAEERWAVSDEKLQAAWNERGALRAELAQEKDTKTRALMWCEDEIQALRAVLEKAKGLLWAWVDCYQVPPEQGGAHQREAMDAQTRILLNPPTWTQEAIDEVKADTAELSAYFGVPKLPPALTPAQRHAVAKHLPFPKDFKPPCKTCGDRQMVGYVDHPVDGECEVPCPTCTTTTAAAGFMVPSESPVCLTCRDTGNVWAEWKRGYVKSCPTCSPSAGGGK